MRAVTAAGAIALSVTALTACGGATAPPPGSAAAPAGTSYYVASSSSEVDLVTWNSSGAGTITADTIDSSGSGPSAPYSLSVNTANIGVTINGNQVTITASSWFGSATVNGTLNGDGLRADDNDRCRGAAGDPRRIRDLGLDPPAPPDWLR